LGDIGVMVMVRPHGGDFCYSADELGAMCRDIRRIKEVGVQGVVCGALTPDGSIDRTACARFIEAARPLEVTFHRAFDKATDPMAALGDLLDLGFDRLLTSGQAKTAVKGAALIRRLVEHAGKQLSIVVGGGVRPENVADLLSTGAKEFHASARKHGPSGSADDLGVVHPVYETDTAAVNRLSQAIRGY
jgi:copper homeostasis protein